MRGYADRAQRTTPTSSVTAAAVEEALVEAVASVAPDAVGVVVVEAAKRLGTRDSLLGLRFLGRHLEGEALLDAVREASDSATARALDLVRDVLGRDALQEVLREGRVVVASRNGRSYAVDLHGEVREMTTWALRCVVCRGPQVHVLDVFLAKALAVRDHPESISTLEGDGRYRVPCPEVGEHVFPREGAAVAWLVTHRACCTYHGAGVTIEHDGPPIDGFAAWNLTKTAGWWGPNGHGDWQWIENPWVIHETLQRSSSTIITAIRNRRTGEVRQLMSAPKAGASKKQNRRKEESRR